MTPEQIEQIKRTAQLDARALQCGYPKRSVPYTGEQLALYEAEYLKTVQAYRAGRK